MIKMLVDWYLFLRLICHLLLCVDKYVLAVSDHCFQSFGDDNDYGVARKGNE